jgi:hypothetical protein
METITQSIVTSKGLLADSNEDTTISPLFWDPLLPDMIEEQQDYASQETSDTAN